jgi:hypothetical protein
MWVFHNVFERGGERGRQAVCRAITPEVRALFQYLVKPDVPWATEDIGNHVRKWGAEMLDGAKGTSHYPFSLLAGLHRTEDARTQAEKH